MKSLANRYATTIAILSVFSIVGWIYSFYVTSTNIDTNVLSAIPDIVENWRGYANPIDERVYELLETRDVLVKRYVRGKDTITLQFVYYPKVKIGFHDPEACNTGTGDKIERIKSEGFMVKSGGNSHLINMNAFVVYRMSGENDLFYYFFKSGEFAGESYIRLKLRMVMKYFQKGNVDAAMIVFSAPINGNIEVTRSRLIGFIESFYPCIENRI